MNVSCCYIDYSKSKNIAIEQKDRESIEIESQDANIYLSIPKNSNSFELLDSDRYTVVLHGSLELDDRSLDTLLELIHNRGVKETLKRVDGVFSLMIYDKKEGLFYFSCDHFGTIQSYYYKSNDLMIFSNSLKTFKNSPLFVKEIDYDTLGQYFQHGYILQPNTLFQNCFRVKSSHFIVVDIATKELKELEYWDLAYFYNQDRVNLNHKKIIDRSEELLRSAIFTKIGESKRVGTFLSGGYDSSAIASILAQREDIELNSFTVGFKNCDMDEAPYAKSVAKFLNIKHNEYYFGSDELQELLLDFAKVYDLPIADKAALPTMLISKRAKESVDIIFGGEGGDEIFASSSLIKRMNQIGSIPYPARFVVSKIFRLFSSDIRFAKYSKILKQRDIENILKYEDIMLSFKGIKRLIKLPIHERPIEFDNININPTSHSLDKLFPLIYKSYVQDDLLPKVYFATNSYGVEPKTPYLDRKFVEFLARVDVKIKHKDGINKYILREILQKYLPLELIDRPKRGFSVPIGKILKGKSREFLDRYINYDRIKKEDILDPDEVMRLKSRFLNSDSYYDEQIIWSILIFELWYEEWFS